MNLYHLYGEKNKSKFYLSFVLILIIVKKPHDNEEIFD